MAKAKSEKRVMTIYVQHANDLTMYKPVDLSQLMLSDQQHQSYTISLYHRLFFVKSQV